MKKLLSPLLIAICLTSFGQVMPSPDASAMIKGINSSVNLYNGVATIPIPLYEAKANNGATVPVVLQYNTGGIKVNEISSVVGSGWQLSAGGSITRVVRDIPDEQSPFTTDLNYQTLRNVANGYRMFDFQKDIFYFSFPGGGGKFIFSANDLFQRAGGSFRRDCKNGCDGLPPLERVDCLTNCDNVYGSDEYAFIASDDFTTTDIVILPSADIRIEFNYRDKYDSDFVITDMQGNKYYFGQTEEAREKTITNFKDNFDNTEYEDKNERSFISSWHLTKIEYANLPASEKINFTYTDATIVNEVESTIVPARVDLNYYAECMASKGAEENCDDCMELNQELDHPYLPSGSEPDVEDLVRLGKHNDYYRNRTTTFKSTIDTKLISSITFSKGHIQFGYSPSRNDLQGGLRLTSVSLRKGSSVVSQTKLDQGFFNASDSYYKGGTLGFTTEKSYRLKLNAIERDGIKVASFDYMNDKEFHANGADQYELPPRDSYYTDHWGYYNGGPHQGETYTWHGTAEVNGNTIRGIKKGITYYSMANLLKTITYPTGGTKEFQYGIHAHHGGTRIQSVKELDENDQIVSHVSYTYTQEFDPPDLSYVENQVVVVPQDWDEVTGKIIPHIFESSQTFVFDLNGPTVGYGLVIERNELTDSSIEHEFIRAGDENREVQYATKSFVKIDTYQDQYDIYDGRPVVNGSVVTLEQIDQHAFPFSTPSVFYFDRGMEKRVTHRDENGMKISEVENHYAHETDLDFSVSNHSFHLEHLDEDAGLLQDNSFEYNYIISRYEIGSRNLTLDHSVTRTYDDLENLIAESRTDYMYSSQYETLPVSVKSEVKDGSKVLQGTHTQTRYPFNKADIDIVHSEAVLDDMVAKNMIAVPVQTVNKVRQPGRLLYEFSRNSLTTFKESHSLIVPFQSYVYPMSGLISNVLHNFNPEDFEVVSTVEYNDQGLIASKTGQDGIVTTYNYNDDGYLTSMTTDPGEESLKRTTSYEYVPLVGIKSVTGPSGRKVSYVYDDQNRLLMTKNNEGNILKRYRYNYATQQSEALGVAIRASSGYNVINHTIGLEAIVSGSDYGSIQYEWSNGDTSPYRTARFENEGNKTISVTVTNAEHADVRKTASTNIYIHNRIAGIYLDGPSSAIYCPGSGDTGFQGPDNGGGSSEASITYNTTQKNFSIQFGSGAKCNTSGYAQRYLEYSLDNGANWTTFSGQSGNAAELPSSVFQFSESDYTIKVRGIYVDHCGSTFDAEKEFTVKRCNSSGDNSGGGSGSGSGSTWAISMSPSSVNLCSVGEPSIASLSIDSSGDHGCASPSLSYTWEYKQRGTSNWNSLPVLGTGNSINVDRSTLTPDPTNPFGVWDVRVTVTDGCGETETASGSISILSDCSGGGGIEGNDGGSGGTGTGDGDGTVGEDGGDGGFEGPSGNN